MLKTICLTNPNTYDDLWDWYNDYNEKKLATYQNRRAYIKNLYAEIISTIVSSKMYCQMKLLPLTMNPCLMMSIFMSRKKL